MSYRVQPLLRPTTASRALAAAVLSLVIVSACTQDEPMPTGPLTIAPAMPAAAILGASSSDLPFEGRAINESGQVVGGTLRAMLWTPGSGVQDLGTLGGASSAAYGINESGQVVGSSLTATGERHAFLWTPGQGMRDLGTLAGGTVSTARGINDRGDVVGESTLPRIGPNEPERHAFLWTPSEGMQDLGTLGPGLTSSIAFDINNARQVVGRAFSANQQISPPTDPEYFSRAFLWAPGSGMQDLGDLSGGHSVAYAINDAGQVVGRSWIGTFTLEYGAVYLAFLWDSHIGMRSLGLLEEGPSSTAAYGISESGMVAGVSDTGPYFLGNSVQGFLWTTEDGMEALFPTTGVRSPRDINNVQQVVGDGRVVTFHRAFGNTPPVAVARGPYSGTEGSAVALDLSATDNEDVAFWYTVSFGDGSRDWFDFAAPKKYTYTDNGAYTLTLTVRDRRNSEDTATTTVTIANVAPTIVAGSLTGPTAPLHLTGGHASAPIAFEFRDPAGTSDTYAAEIACGNGTVLTPKNIPVSNTYVGNTYAGGVGTYTGECTYTSPGVYTVRVTVSDDDGGVSAPASFESVVVLAPVGGSVTAAGFYDMPGQGDRKAHFTFHATSLPGEGTMPNGTVKLWIPTRDLDFVSTAVEMLVVSGDRAQFWGTGTLNGATARFRITAVDGQMGAHNANADAVRVELWDVTGALVYDSQPGAARDAPVTQTIEGGNIQIHSE